MKKVVLGLVRVGRQALIGVGRRANLDRGDLFEGTTAGATLDPEDRRLGAVVLPTQRD